MSETRYEQYIQALRIQKLFRAVLVLAAKDAFQNSSENGKKIRREAEAFFDSYFDMTVVCKLANVDFFQIKKVTQEKFLTNRQKYDKIISEIED
ncbi:MAG: hypothetical protein J5895_00700 [Alphaproteobacteria bacterium]|nr:hypothetical protein [Alphaproteobacteria bacterium]